MEEPIKTIEKSIFKANIYIDECPIDPLENDEFIFNIDLCHLKNYDIKTNNANFSDINHIPAINLNRVYDIYAYIHSGITISTTPFSCPWDSGHAGYAWISNEDAEAYTPEQLSKILKEEVELIDNYLAGDCYYFEIINTQTGEELETLYGFYGIEDTEAELNATLQSYIDSTYKQLEFNFNG